MSAGNADSADTTPGVRAMTSAAFSSTLRSQGGVVLHKVAEIDLGGREVTVYFRLTSPRGPRILHDLAEAEDAFDRERERSISLIDWSPGARVA
ncbi:hypothetical protein [Brevundimonas sp.]|uniref:hypothetical protein n=1 Tax=Brevundimonas sp. TaxID=1871086 RepID=UPI00391B3C3A